MSIADGIVGGMMLLAAMTVAYWYGKFQQWRSQHPKSGEKVVFGISRLDDVVLMHTRCRGIEHAAGMTWQEARRVVEAIETAASDCEEFEHQASKAPLGLDG